MAVSMKCAGMPTLQTRLTRGSFMGTKVAPMAPRLVRASPIAARATNDTAGFSSDWLKKNPIVPVLGFLGWTIPANIPTSALGGKSLFGAFLGSIGANLAHFPTGPALTDPFWLYLAVYHVGLFTTLLLGQIGVNGRKEGYW